MGEPGQAGRDGSGGAVVDPGDVVLTASTSEAYSWLFKLLCDAGLAIEQQRGASNFSARTIEGVSGLMNLVMLPMWILSGTFFSYARFPDAMIPFVKALPLTALNDALRAVMIDGSAVTTLGAPIAIVSAWGAVSFVIALKIFRWR